MDNSQFLKVISHSFKVFLSTGSRSNEKLKVLHGAIAEDLQERLGTEYQVCSLGFEKGREANIEGRYIDKKVDITIKKGDQTVAGIGVKFVMQNYSQNSNNYFENMLGETANIRCARIPYFQIFVIPDRLPYYNDKKELEKWETFTTHNVAKYLTLSEDNFERYLHTPNKTLLFVVHIPDSAVKLSTRSAYVEYYKKEHVEVRESPVRYGKFDSSVIYNDYEEFAQKVYYSVMAL